MAVGNYAAWEDAEAQPDVSCQHHGGAVLIMHDAYFVA